MVSLLLISYNCPVMVFMYFDCYYDCNYRVYVEILADVVADVDHSAVSLHYLHKMFQYA